jgi:hypothetical protein
MDRDERLTAALNRRAPRSAANQRAFGRLLPQKARAALPRNETAFGSADDRQFAGIHEAVAVDGVRAQWQTRDSAQYRARAEVPQYGASEDVEGNWSKMFRMYTDNTDADYADNALSANMRSRPRAPRRQGRGRMTDGDDVEGNWGRVGTLYTDYEDQNGSAHEYRYQSADTDEGTGGYDSHGYHALSAPSSDGGLYHSSLPVGDWAGTSYANSMGSAQGTVNEGLHIGGQASRGGPSTGDPVSAALTGLATFASRAGMALRTAAGFGPKPRAGCSSCAKPAQRLRTGRQELMLHDQLRANRGRAATRPLPADATHDMMVRRGKAAAATRALTGSAGGAASKCAGARDVGRGRMAAA